jgi:hypothetical protein
VRCLSIQQPWAWCIVHGYKPVENRDWPTNVRGEFAIHAGKKYDEEGEWIIRSRFQRVLLPKRELIPLGGIVGVARLVRVVDDTSLGALSADEEAWYTGRYGFVLADARPVPFVPLRGQLGFFAADYTPPAHGGTP